MKARRIPHEFLPLQSGVGNIANAVLAALGKSKAVPRFEMYTEVLQDSVVGLLESGRCSFASTCALTLSPEMMRHVAANLDFFKRRVLLRPQEISNHPEIVRRLGVVSMNTAIEVDLGGNVNSTHVVGKTMHERHRRVGRLHAQRLPVDLLLPLDGEGRQDLRHRAPGGAHGPQRAFRAGRGDGAGRRRPTRQGPARARRICSSTTAPPGLPRPVARLPETDQGRARTAVAVARPGHAPPVPASRRHARHQRNSASPRPLPVFQRRRSI